MSISINLKSWFQTSKLSDQSNESLMLRYAKKQDSELLAALYDNCARDLNLFLSTLAGEELAQEIAQRTWVKVIDKAHLYREQGKFKNWLFTLGRRTLLDEFRKQNRFVDISEQTAELTSSDEYQENAESLEQHYLKTLENTSLLDAYDKALTELPFLQKEAFCLQQEGFSLSEIASLTGDPTETVKSRLRYAKKSLQTSLIPMKERIG